MEATGRYHEPMAAALHEHGICVTVINPLFIEQSSGGSIRNEQIPKMHRGKASPLLASGGLASASGNLS